jgi:hypothetical protein
MTDDAAIRHLMARYTMNGDRGKLEALAETFAEDGTLAFSGAASTGRAAIVARLAAPAARNPALTLSRHHLTSCLIDIDGERATGRTYFQVLTDIGLDHHGVYIDAMEKIAGAWLFRHRDVRIDWQSPRSLYASLHVRGIAPARA